jgi:hypothetical protein
VCLLFTNLVGGAGEVALACTHGDAQLIVVPAPDPWTLCLSTAWAGLAMVIGAVVFIKRRQRSVPFVTVTHKHTHTRFPLSWLSTPFHSWMCGLAFNTNPNNNTHAHAHSRSSTHTLDTRNPVIPCLLSCPATLPQLQVAPGARLQAQHEGRPSATWVNVGLERAGATQTGV